MNQDQIVQKIKAVDKLLHTNTTSKQKFNQVRTILKGIDPRVDKTLASCNKAWGNLEKIHQKKIVDLTAQNLPEKTRLQKKRKRALLLFLRYWSQLKSEVKRVEAEIHTQTSQPQTATSKATSATKIIRFAKGPLGLVTIAAAGIASVAIIAQAKSATISVTNNGCPAINPAISKSINLPGISLPSTPIQSGASAQFILPPIPITVSGSSHNTLSITTFGRTQTVSFPTSITNVTYDGASLLGKTTKIDLSGNTNHSLVITCD